MKDKIINNLEDVLKIMDYNELIGIKVYRLNCQVAVDKGTTSQWITTHIKDCDCCAYTTKPKRIFKIVNEFSNA